MYCSQNFRHSCKCELTYFFVQTSHLHMSPINVVCESKTLIRYKTWSRYKMLGIRLHVYQNYKNFQELNWVILSLNIRLHAGLWSHRQSKQFSMAAAGAKNF